MAINFPDSPTAGSTYTYQGVTYTWQDTSGGAGADGYWKVNTPGTLGPATGADLDAGTDNAKYATAKALEDSKYVKEDVSGVTELNHGGSKRLETTSTGTKTTGNCVVTGKVTADNLRTASYNTSDAPNGDVAGSDMFGDTSVGVGAVDVRATRVGDHVTISGTWVMNGFSTSMPNDDSYVAKLKIDSVLSSLGMGNFTDNSYGTASVKVDGTPGYDYNTVAARCRTISGSQIIQVYDNQCSATGSIIDPSLILTGVNEMVVNFTIVGVATEL